MMIRPHSLKGRLALWMLKLYVRWEKLGWIVIFGAIIAVALIVCYLICGTAECCLSFTSSGHPTLRW